MIRKEVATEETTTENAGEKEVSGRLPVADCQKMARKIVRNFTGEHRYMVSLLAANTIGDIDILRGPIGRTWYPGPS